MTEKEAIEGLKPIVDNEAYTDRFQDVCRAAIKALEKQMPKKPRFNETRFRHRGRMIGECTTLEDAYNCPKCNLTVWESDKPSYCDQCGQRLDWGE